MLALGLARGLALSGGGGGCPSHHSSDAPMEVRVWASRKSCPVLCRGDPVGTLEGVPEIGVSPDSCLQFAVCFSVCFFPNKQLEPLSVDGGAKEAECVSPCGPSRTSQGLVWGASSLADGRVSFLSEMDDWMRFRLLEQVGYPMCVWQREGGRSSSQQQCSGR